MMYRSRPAAIACLLWLISAVAYAQTVAESVTRSLAREQRIRETLDDDTRLEFIECPLQEICDFLSDLHAIPVQIDTRALEEAGLESDMPVTRNLKGVSLRSALDLLLDEHELSWAVHDEVLLITTAAAARTKASVRVHNVSDLLSFGDPADRLASTLETAIGGQAPDEKSAIVRIVPFQQMLIVHSTERGHRDVENLLVQIRASKHGPSFGIRPASPPTAVRSRSHRPSSVKLEWGVGERVRYGLVGFMDFDGDGKSDRELLRTLILSSKGILDAEVEDDGAVKGRMSIHTHYLVVGDPPDRTKEGPVRAYALMTAEGQELGIQKVSAEKMFRKLQEHAEEMRKREERAAAQREATKRRQPDPFAGGGTNPFGPAPQAKPQGSNADPFGAPGPPQKPKDAGADPFAADPFAEHEPAKSDKPKKPSAAPDDPFGT